MGAAVIVSWASLKIESPGPQNGSLLLTTKIALQFPALHDGRSFVDLPLGKWQ